MNPLGVGDVGSQYVSQILTEASGASIPTSITIKGENGAAIAGSSLTALFNQSGTFVGAFGIDPSTGAFAAWDANGNETNYQLFSALHGLTSGAVPVSSAGSNAFLYNSSGQLIGLDVAGYTVNVPTSAQETSDVEDGLTDVYDRSGTNLLGSFGYDVTTGDIDIDGSSADGQLEALGYTAAQIAQAEQSLDGSGAWNESDPTDADIQQSLTQILLAQGSSVQGAVGSSVYMAGGQFMGSYGGDTAGDGYYIYNEVGTPDPTTVLQDDGATAAQVQQALGVLTANAALGTVGYANLNQVNQALAAYELSNPDSPNNRLARAVDIYDDGAFVGIVGVLNNEIYAREADQATLIPIDFPLQQQGLTMNEIQGWATAPSLTED
jgi:hypothetical protein